jgi:hypothetical protein
MAMSVRRYCARVLLVSAVASTVVSIVPSFALAASGGAVDDETRGAARKLGTEGVKAYQAGDYDVASEKLERAFSLLEAPSLGLWSARALEKKGQLVKAAERYLKTTRLPVEAGGEANVQEQAKADAAAEREALLPRIPELVIEIEGADPSEVEVTINGAPVKAALIGTARPTDPGTAEIVARSGSNEVRQRVDLEEGQSRTVTLNVETGQAIAHEGESAPKGDSTAAVEADDAGPSAPKSRWQIPVGWTFLGLGVAGLATGGITAGIAASDYSTLSMDCPGDICPAGSDVSGYNTMRIVSSVGFIAGGVLAATGVTFLLLAPKRQESAYVVPVLGFGTVGVRGRF